ncbi:MAG: T9SS type A sorting domain-containing protein [Bacteroidales bacterium]|jgi:hypothetical protein
MNRLIFIILILFQEVAAMPQGFIRTAEQLRTDSIRLAALPELVLDHRLKSGTLPYSVDNSRSFYFPPIFTQFAYTCNQCSSIAYLFTYETNVLRRKASSAEENRLSLLFPWNMLNSGINNMGVSYFDSWDVVDDAGCPNVVDFGHGTGTQTDDGTIWMTGYQKYYRAMQNRIEGIYSIDIGTIEGLQTLKGWLFNHGGGLSPGGVASFQIASGAYQLVTLPEGTEDAGKTMITRFSAAVGHSMTFVGYNDSVRYDYNHDGRYTNDIDITGDGMVTMADWEKGALICVDSYQASFFNTAKAYVAYRLLPNNHANGGIFMRSAVVARVHKTYKPKLGLRVALSYPIRSKLWITAGVSQDPNAIKPDHILDIPVFRYQGGSFAMQGLGSGNRNRIEIGIDASPLLDFVEPGREASFFLVINEKDPDETSDGMIEQASFIDYTHGTEEHYLDIYYLTLVNGYQDFKTNFTPSHNPPVIVTPSLPGAVAGEPFQLQLEATGGTAPYSWLPISRTFREEVFTDTFPAITEIRILPVIGNDVKATVNLPFSFPLYDKRFTRMTVYTDGALMFEASTYTYPYAIDKLKLLAFNRAIYPWYNSDLSLPQMNDWIYFQADHTRATIRWNASVLAGGSIYDVNFAARLYPSGVIEFYYGNIEMRPFFMWFMAIAGGQADQLQYPDANITGVRNGLNIRFIPDDYPEGITLSPEGLLSGTSPEPGRSWTFPVWVKDYNKLRGMREFTLNTGSLGTPVPSSPEPLVTIYPNPVSEEISIQILHARPGTLTLEITDLTGRRLLRNDYQLGGGEALIRCPEVARLMPGVYIYRISGVAEGCGRLVRLNTSR